MIEDYTCDRCSISLDFDDDVLYPVFYPKSWLNFSDDRIKELAKLDRSHLIVCDNCSKFLDKVMEEQEEKLKVG